MKIVNQLSYIFCLLSGSPMILCHLSSCIFASGNEVFFTAFKKYKFYIPNPRFLVCNIVIFKDSDLLFWPNEQHLLYCLRYMKPLCLSYMKSHMVGCTGLVCFSHPLSAMCHSHHTTRPMNNRHQNYLCHFHFFTSHPTQLVSYVVSWTSRLVGCCLFQGKEIPPFTNHPTQIRMGEDRQDPSMFEGDLTQRMSQCHKSDET